MVSLLNTTDKRDSPNCRVIMDLSFPPGNSVNDRIPKDSYLGEEINLCYPSVDASTESLREKGRDCGLMKSDLKHAYKQIFVDPGDWIFLGMKWKGHLYFDMTMPMGLRSSAMCCHRITNAVRFIMRSKGFGLVAYLDNICLQRYGSMHRTALIRWKGRWGWWVRLRLNINLWAQTRIWSFWGCYLTQKSWRWKCPGSEYVSAWACWMSGWTKRKSEGKKLKAWLGS